MLEIVGSLTFRHHQPVRVARVSPAPGSFFGSRPSFRFPTSWGVHRCLLVAGPRQAPGLLFGLPRDGLLRGVAAGGPRRGPWIVLPQRTTRSGRGRGRLRPASRLGLLVSYHRQQMRAAARRLATHGATRYQTTLCSKEPMLARLGRFRCGAIM